MSITSYINTQTYAMIVLDVVKDLFFTRFFILVSFRENLSRFNGLSALLSHVINLVYWSLISLKIDEVVANEIPF